MTTNDAILSSAEIEQLEAMLKREAHALDVSTPEFVPSSHPLPVSLSSESPRMFRAIAGFFIVLFAVGAVMSTRSASDVASEGPAAQYPGADVAVWVERGQVDVIYETLGRPTPLLIRRDITNEQIIDHVKALDADPGSEGVVAFAVEATDTDNFTEVDGVLAFESRPTCGDDVHPVLERSCPESPGLSPALPLGAVVVIAMIGLWHYSGSRRWMTARQYLLLNGFVTGLLWVLLSLIDRAFAKAGAIMAEAERQHGTQMECGDWLGIQGLTWSPDHVPGFEFGQEQVTYGIDPALVSDLDGVAFLDFGYVLPFWLAMIFVPVTALGLGFLVRAIRRSVGAERAMVYVALAMPSIFFALWIVNLMGIAPVDGPIGCFLE